MKEQDIKLLEQTTQTAIARLQLEKKYKVVYANRLLRAVKHLELLIKELNG